MKAAVITLHTVSNYGTQLQAFATQEKLKEYFDEVLFVDYRRPDTYGKRLINTFAKGNPVRAFAIIPTIIYWRRIFGDFQKKFLNIDNKVFLSEEDFKNYQCTADIYFSGSDQVWNTGWNNGIIPPFYLSFVPKDKPKYAYASSFGKNKLTKDEIKKSKKYIEQFKKISVREESGVTILKHQYKYETVTRIVDPTLAMTGDFWRKYSTKRKIKKPYILIYNLNRSKEFDEYAKELSKRTGYKLYRFCTRFDQIFRNGKSLVIPQIFDFINYVDNAEIVLTDSFHATAFAMNLNTEPICIYPHSYSGRLSEFLKLVDSENRHINSYDDYDVINRHVDFSKVNKILDAERKKVDNFLQSIIEENKKKE